MTFDLLPAQPEGLFAVFQAQGDALAGIDRQHVMRGDILVAEGSAPDALYLVISGRFQVTRGGIDLAEIGVGSPIAEISFFTGQARTATVTAARDSVVARISAEDYARLAVAHPDLPKEIARFLALRLASTSARVRPEPAPPLARTVALIPAGEAPLDPAFAKSLGEALRDMAPTRIVTRDEAQEALGQDLDSPQATTWFNALETGGSLVLFIADQGDPDWSRRALRQADQVITQGVAGPVPPLSEVERFAASVLPDAHRRLVLIHPEQRGWVSGTEHWLDARPVFMHHHVAAEEDIRRIARFLTGQARGFVAGGGGALGAMHTGVYAGLRQAGVTFDIFGGTSVGSAMAGAFAMGLDGDEIARRTGEIFVKGKALAKLTFPRYSLLDHTHFDRHLRAHYTEGLIENLWYPFFAVATDLSNNALHLIRRGPLWEAIRASSAIPGALPPFYDDEGRMLADGGSMDNVPYRTMRQLKAGPNVVVNFGRSEARQYDVDYPALPGRRTLVRRMLLPFLGKPPRAPGPFPVLMRSLMARQASVPHDLGPEDWYIRPPLPKGVGFMDWSSHKKLYQAGKETVAQELAAPAEPGSALALFQAMRR